MEKNHKPKNRRLSLLLVSKQCILIQGIIEKNSLSFVLQDNLGIFILQLGNFPVHCATAFLAAYKTWQCYGELLSLP
jgi:hypothetical protein